MVRKLWPLLIVIVSMMVVGCAPSTGGTPPPQYSRYELAYRLLDEYNDFFWCDPYEYPIARPEQEKADARAQFQDIRANLAEFTAILSHLGLADKPDYTDAEQLSIFREHNKINGAVQVTPAGEVYDFILRTGEGQGKRFEGTITPAGKVKVEKEEPSINTCPICLAAGTAINTPGGPIPVENLRPGEEVWTVDGDGRTVAGRVLAVSTMPVPPSFQVLRLTLADGRNVTASPSHPTAAGRALGSYKIGEFLDGAWVTAIEMLPCEGGKTYDLLPAGPTGLYLANTILLKSTLAMDDN